MATVFSDRPKTEPGRRSCRVIIIIIFIPLIIIITIVVVYIYIYIYIYIHNQFHAHTCPPILVLFWPHRSHASRCQFVGRQPLLCPSGGREDSPTAVGSYPSMSCLEMKSETATLGGPEVERNSSPGA